MERSRRGLSRSWISIFTLILLFAIQPWGRAAQAATIDIMLVYDSTATTWVGSNGGMDAFSQDVVNRMNLAMQNTGVSISFRLVHSMSVNYTTQSSLSTPLTNDLKALQAGRGAFAAVAAARDAYGADLVAMLVDHGYSYGYVGQGYMLNSWSGNSDYAYTVNAIRSVAISHTLTHEVGHNLGAHHSKYQTSDPGPNVYLDGQFYSAGWYFIGANGVDYHTIMAYDNDGHGNSYEEAPLFSTPLKTYQGMPAGDAVNGDNARLLRTTGDVIADYRLNATPTELTVPVALAATDITSTAFTARWSSVSGATGYRLNYTQYYDPQDLGWVGDYEIDLGNDTSYVLSGLNPGEWYFYRVQAYNASGASDYSNIVSVVTISEAVAPVAPLAIAAADVSSSGFTARWDSVSDATGYWLDVSTSSTFGLTGESFDERLGNVTSYEFNWASPNTTYYYRVRAYNDSGESDNSNVVSVTTTSDSGFAQYERQVYVMFAGYFGRPPAPAGLAYYEDHMEKTSGNYLVIVDDFFKSSESQALYSLLSTEEKINLVFQFLFARSPRSSGLSYWSDMVDRGQISVAEMAYAIAYNAAPEDEAVLSAKSMASAAFVEELERVLKVQVCSMDIDLGREFLDGIRNQSDADNAILSIGSTVAAMCQ